MPDSKCKEGIEIQKKFNSIPKVSTFDYAAKFNHEGIVAPNTGNKNGAPSLLLTPEVYAFDDTILIKVVDIYHKQKKYSPPEGLQEIMGSEYYTILVDTGIIVYPADTE